MHGSATVETLVDGLSGPRAAALNSTHVYWVAPFYGMILRVTKNGGDVELIHSGQGNVVDIVATEDTIYWSTWENNSAGGVFASALEGGPIETIATGQNGVYRLVLDENTLYWSGYDSKTISKKEIGGINTEVITNTTTAPWGIATDASHVYWVQSGDKTIRKTHKDGCEEKILASGLEGSLLNLTVDDTHVYWTNGSGGQQILKMLK